LTITNNFLVKSKQRNSSLKVASYVLTGALTQQVHIYDIHIQQILRQAPRLMMILQDK